MDSLLKHMVDMTAQRDHARLDISVVAAVHELTRALQTRILKIHTVAGQPCLRARAWVSGTGPAQLEELHDAAPGEPLAAPAELVHCLAGRHASAEAPQADGTRLMWLPVWSGDQASACLEIHSAQAFGDEALHTIGAIAGVYRNFQNLLDYSERDCLTGLLNRKTFENQLARMLHGPREPARRDAGLPERRHPHAEEKQWLAVVDVDLFKAVNDKYGHLYGDEVLILIANLLQSSFRTQDRIFRFGGEEFVVLLRSTTLEHAWKIIERFRAAVEQHAFPQVGPVTVSVGFVAISVFESPVVSLGHADQALYYAKSSGRNRACHYDDLVSRGVLRAVASNDTAEFF